MPSLEPFYPEVIHTNGVYVTGLVIIGLVLISISWAYGTDIKYIKGIPEVPGAIPIFGHLLKLGEDHASSCEKWWRQYNEPVFQIKLGNTRAVVFNSFEACRDILVKHHNAVIDRPKLYTFHGVISSTQGFTIGSSPWDSSCKNKRKAAGTALSRPAMRNYHPMFDLESFCILRDMHKDSNNSDPNIEISIRPYIQRFALNTTLTLCYGIRMDDTYDDLLREILHVGSAISLLRSASENMQDYVPALRYLPNNDKTTRSKDLRSRRDAYLNLLLDKVREMIKKGTDKPCISAAILKDEETKLTGVEVSSICLSLVSGGFETIPGTLTSCLGSLCTPEGQIFQERAYADIKRHYPDIRNAWQNSFQEEKVPYLKAIIQEAGRYYTVSSMSLPRRTVTEVNWNGAIIPPKTMILVNAQAGNHDSDHFGPDAKTFNPERWLEPITEKNHMGPFQERVLTSQAHLSFGAGTRACSGQLIATRLLYSALIRILSSYKIVASESEPPNTDYVDYNQFKTALVAIPRDFKVRLIPRDKQTMEECMQAAYERTKEHYKEDVKSVYFVRSLEERVRELEGQQASLASPGTRQYQVEGATAQLEVNTTRSPDESTNQDFLGNTDVTLADQRVLSQHGDDVSEVYFERSPIVAPQQGDVSSSLPHQETLAQNLRDVSLAAVAEPYLGTISGLTFAKLTQAVLRRLSPDGRDFVFSPRRDNNTVPIEGATHLHLDLINSMYFDYDQAIDFSLLAGEGTSPACVAPSQIETTQLPGRPEVLRLAKFYFDHSHTLYPIVHQQEVMSDIYSILEDPEYYIMLSPASMFRIWMVLAIGSTTYSSITLAEEYVSRMYYEKAMTFFDASMDHGDIVALEALMLQVSFSFFNQLGPNTWFLVGTAARLALGMGLHCDSTFQGLSEAQTVRRKRLFFSIYMMDRLVSITLGRPFAIHEDHIDISSFTIEACEDLDYSPNSARSTLCKPPMAITSHILQLRRIANDIATKVYCKRVVSRYSATERQEVLAKLRQDLVNWRQSVPFPLPNLDPRVPQGCLSWYDLNFYTHLTTLYRPSPLFPTLDIDRVNILTEAAAMAIRHANSMRLQKRLAFNWLNLLTIYNLVIALVYSVTVQPENLAASLERLHAVDDLELATELFTVLGEKFPASRTIGAMISQIIDRYRLMSSGPIC
ncbi:cytochrome P450 [Aureobasidium subglaciale]|nr:cytochrome P450 [Aureobasidium subglaciale]KAI5216421.1 cytochrome P450 [Aureobasidium subglaciale]KAI5257625.1 cytochrome P450 [Aureobasidium subglaciale]